MTLNNNGLNDKLDILSMQNITKIYSNGFVANNNVNFSVKKGEIHGLIGENGAGKTTLMKVLFGQETPEEGSIFLSGQKVNITNPLVALGYGIGMVHQHFMLVDSLSVAENMVLGREPVKGLTFNYQKAIEETEEISKRFELPINPKALIRDLSVGYKQRVEILKMLLHGAKILLLDEPTAVLTPQETRELFVQLLKLKELGYSIVFISHKLNEVKEICDRITILRDGMSIATVNIEDITEQEISRLMVGREVVTKIEKDKAKPGEAILKIRNLSHLNKYGSHSFEDINLDVRRGEILGIAGVEGNGQSELASVLAGLEKPLSGSIKINDKETEDMSIRDIRDNQVSLIHEDRMIYGVSTNQSVAENTVSDRYYKKRYNAKGFLDNKKVNNDAKSLIEQFLIKCDDEDSLIKTLSGGNIQKVVAAREFSSNPNLLIVSQPTRGIDVGAAELIRRKMIELRDNRNAGILLFSADLGELLNISDSIAVMYGGKIVAYFSNVENLTEEILGEYMLGLKKQKADDMVGMWND